MSKEHYKLLEYWTIQDFVVLFGTTRQSVHHWINTGRLSKPITKKKLLTLATERVQYTSQLRDKAIEALDRVNKLPNE